ncbi:phosphatidate cytidylyltransferase [Scenedesmus sp. NREL 46B-D3]|nr:phosphatidate cytidylyltransferase [Scenedesmus sp. NREL 46B-D3]
MRRNNSTSRRRERLKFVASEDGTDRDTEAEATDKEQEESAQETQQKRVASLRTRTVSTLAMIAGFLGVIYAGHVPLVFLVLGLQYLIVKELFMMARVAQKDRRVPGFRAQQWYFFFVGVFYLYLRFIKNNLLVELTTSKYASAFAWLLRRHTIMAYYLYMAGFVMFVLSLKKGMYGYQFGQYAWTHMILLTIFLPSSFFVSNIFEGLIWFLLPSALIITNDIMAYLAGYFWGRTPLIKLSPKKTWEGFIGGFFGTVICAALLANILSRFKWMTCPREDLSMGRLHCTPDPIYSPNSYTLQAVAELLPPSLLDVAAAVAAQLPAGLRHWLAALTVTMRPMELHAMVLAVFASFVAPFGGFFGSGFKRAFKMKDFGDTIPGHGGVTDRFDCQMIMAMFAYLYYWNYVAAPAATLGEALEVALRLEQPELLVLWGRLGNLLLGEGLLPGDMEPALQAALAAANSSAAAAGRWGLRKAHAVAHAAGL